jgi:hypothetical protein
MSLTLSVLLLAWGAFIAKTFLIPSENTSFGHGEIVDVTTYLDPTETKIFSWIFKLLG